MKNNILIILFVIILAFSSCSLSSNKEKTLKLKLIKSVELPLNNPDFDYPSCAQYCYIDSIETIIFYFSYQNLVFYDLNAQKKYHEINLNFKQIDGFKYFSKDSIYVLYSNVVNNSGFFDSIPLVRMNYYGEVQDSFSYYNENNQSFIRSQGNPIDKKDAVYPYLSGALDIIDNENVFLFLKDYYHFAIGTEDFIANKKPLMAMYDLESQKLKTSEKIWYPNITQGIYYPSDNFELIHYGLSHNGLPLIQFDFSSDLFEWDYNNDTYKKFTLKSRLLDTIYPAASPTLYTDNSGIEAKFLKIIYDPYRELYYSSLIFSSEVYDYGVRTLIISDKDFNYLGEIYGSEVFLNTLFTKDYIIDYTKIQEDGVIRIDYYELAKTNNDLNKYLEQIKDSILKIKENKEHKNKEFISEDDNMQLINYLNKNIEVKEESYSLVTIYARDGCPSCRETVLNIINNNIDVFEEVPLYLIVGGRSSNDVYEELNGLEEVKAFSKLVIDTMENVIYMDPVHNRLRNPRLTIVKDNSVVLDSIYDASDIYTVLIPELLKSLKLGYEM